MINNSNHGPGEKILLVIGSLLWLIAGVLVLFIIGLLVGKACYGADPWSRSDVEREVAAQVLHFVDLGQTLDIAAQPARYHEINPMLGQHPTREQVYGYFIGTALFNLGVTHVLPSKYRPYFQYFRIGLSGACILNNFNVGLTLRY